MPTEAVSNVVGPNPRLPGGAPQPSRSTRVWQLTGISTLAGAIALTAIAVPSLVATDEQRPEGAAVPAAPTASAAPSAAPSVIASSPGPTRQSTGTAAEPRAPGRDLAASQPGRQATPAPPPRPSATPDRTTKPPSFSPVSVEAEDPGNVLSEGAGIATCPTCEGGARVRYVGRLTANLTTTAAGSRTVTVTYQLKGDRSLMISINGAVPTVHRLTGTDWSTPRTFRYTADVPAGRISMAFYNDTGPAPDIDKITIS
ncbi:hypothetical protein KBX50_15895 [Micromonospora sp. C51]|uniref:hypothetical protein n=1 Tax=Micromonospora sp. C51 TaxID=2824879 RepID=UPI001B38D712|nr:hypothetical protein [Micromonospora sp. C51]MBQ1049941.1 hypothetical protein [Micromonospora sp. C51]